MEYRVSLWDWVALDAKEGSYFGATPNDLSNGFLCLFYRDSGKDSKDIGKDEDARSIHGLHESILKAIGMNSSPQRQTGSSYTDRPYPLSDVWIGTRGI